MFLSKDIYKKILRKNLKYKKLLKKYRHDELTGILIRREFKYYINKMKENKMNIVFIDVNNFKTINDTYGHKKGDEILAAIGKELKKSFRKKDLSFRYGGDEFILILNDIKIKTSKKRMYDFISHLSMKIEKKYNINVTFSAGIVPFTKKKKIGEILDIVDKLTYKSKKETGNFISVKKFN